MNINPPRVKFLRLGGMAAAIASTATSALLVSTTPAAAATTVYPGCSAGGFSGTIRIDYQRINPVQARIFGVSYRINKGRNRGGNNANVYYTDNGTLPVKRFGKTRGIQDGNWQYLGGNYSTGSSNGIAIKFIFDKSLASDPSCTTYYRLPR